MREHLPEDWPLAPIGELFEMQLGKMLSKEASTGPRQARYLANRHVQWDRVMLDALDTMSFSAAEREKFNLRAGDILVCEGGEVGRTALWRGEATDVFFQKALHRLRPLNGRIEPGYMLRFMRRAADTGAFTDLASQTSIAHLTREKLALLRVPTPPLPEQRQIAAILDTVDDAIRKTEQIIAKLKQVKQGLLHDLLTRGIDHNGELRDPERHPEQFKDSPLGRIPSGWTTVELGQLVDPARPIVYGILMPGTGYQGGVPVVKVRDIKDGQIALEDLLLTSPSIDHEYRRSRLKPGDLLFTIRGTVGRMAFVPPQLDRANITQDTARIGLVRGNPHVVREYLNMPTPRAFIETHTIGVAVRGINLRDLRRVTIAEPPRSESDEIAFRLQSASARQEAESEEVAKLRLLKAGLMEDLLTGRVRVTPLLVASAP